MHNPVTEYLSNADGIIAGIGLNKANIITSISVDSRGLNAYILVLKRTRMYPVREHVTHLVCDRTAAL